MSKYRFSEAQRHAVYTVHGERCYLCGAILTMRMMEVDHVIPEFLRDAPERLAEVKASLGRPADFSIDSYENWLPACRKCNGRKLAIVFEPSPIIQIELQRAAAKADRARKIEQKAISDKQIDEAMSLLLQVDEKRELPEEVVKKLWPLVAFHRVVREPELAKEPVRVTDWLSVPVGTVLSDDGSIRTVKGIYGIGGGPSGPASNGMRCGVCGNSDFRGAICVWCGAMDD